MFAYSAPVVSHLAGDSVLPTVGAWVVDGAVTPSNVTLVGAQFGPPGSSLVVTYTSAVDGIVRRARNCTRDPVRHAWVSCYGVQGVGVLHHWTVNVSGQGSNPSVQTTSFLPPQPLSVYGPGGHNANTDGGQVVLIDGFEFGPASSVAPESVDALIRVVYGPASWLDRYTAENCRVTSASPLGSTLSCITIPGTGGDLLWTVTVGNQTAASAVGPTAYGWPVIATFEGVASTSGVTEGFETVMIFGSNFGQCLHLCVV